MNRSRGSRAISQLQINSRDSVFAADYPPQFMVEHATQYSNTDLDLKSASPLDILGEELEPDCDVLHCAVGEDGNWHMTIESSHGEITANRSAELDIPAMLGVIANLSANAKQQFDACFLRDFNIGFGCWDSWGYHHKLSHDVLRAIVDAGCTLSVTLYPMRNPDGTAKEQADGG